MEDLDRLVLEYYDVLAGEGGDGDGHWQIAERWSYGERLGWFIEHDGKCYRGLDELGEEGPYLSLEAAKASMEEHLKSAIAGARKREE